ncbi:MAG: putative protease [Gemmataceae bacterium]|nr:putative protease [Gemmataceae bacterium]
MAGKNLDGVKVRAWDMTDWGSTFTVDRALDDARSDDFDALLLPGGVLNPNTLRMDEIPGSHSISVSCSGNLARPLDLHR